MPSVTRTLVLRNRAGLHIRPAAAIVRAAMRSLAQVTLCCGGETSDAKDLMGLLLLAAGPGSEVVVEAVGEGAQSVAEEIAQLIESGFGELVA